MKNIVNVIEKEVKASSNLANGEKMPAAIRGAINIGSQPIRLFNMFFRSQQYVEYARNAYETNKRREDELTDNLKAAIERKRLIDNRREILSRVGALLLSGERNPEVAAFRAIAEDVSGFATRFDQTLVKRRVDPKDPTKISYEPFPIEILPDTNAALEVALRKLEGVDEGDPQDSLIHYLEQPATIG